MKNSVKHIRDKKAEERTTLLAEKREELRAARFAAKGAQNRNTKHIAAVRKEIARILTIDTEEATK